MNEHVTIVFRLVHCDSLGHFIYQMLLESDRRGLQNEPTGFGRLIDGESGVLKTSFREMAQGVEHRFALNPNQAAKRMV